MRVCPWLTTLSEKLRKKGAEEFLNPSALFTYLAVFMANATLYFVCVVTGIMMQFALHTGH